MNKVIKPGKIHPAQITLPSSKSLTHRAFISASLANGTSIIHAISQSQDIEATISVLMHGGVHFEKKGSDVIVHGVSKLHYDGSVLDCNESGSTLRFLIPLFALSEQEVSFTGHGKLMDRPQSVYESIFQEKGLSFVKKENKYFVVGPLMSGNYTMQGNVSSQFISGMLFALPLLEGDSTIDILPPFESSSYVGLTIDTLQQYGIHIEQNGKMYHIIGKQVYQPKECTVAGDDSQMAFFAFEALIHQVPLDLLNLRHDSQQGDHVIIDIIRQMGGEVTEIANGYRIGGCLQKAATIDLADCPDLGPALFALASQCEGTTTFLNVARLRMKESDRIACMEEELTKMGCCISSDNNTVTVQGRTKVLGNCVVNGHHDHRIVMALAILATIADGPVTIEGSEAINKSYPNFFDDLGKTGVDIHD